MNMLEVKGVSKHFGSLRAVDDVTLMVAPGELRAIIGPNGAGKTTFFNLISGFFPPNSGEIVFDGEVITQLPVAARVARGMARTFQITKSAAFPGASAPRSRCRPKARAALRVTPASASSAVRPNSRVPMLIVSRSEVAGAEPGLQSVASAMSAPADRNAAIGGLRSSARQ